MMDMFHARLAGSTRSRSAHDQVVNGIGRGIVEGRYPVGQTLPGDADLMERFGVSRTALREGLKTLAAKGLIESKTRVGTRVLEEKSWNLFDADILSWRLQQGADKPFLESLFEIRQALEPLAAAAAAHARSEDDLARIREALERMFQEHHSRESFTLADVAFHRAVLDASGNPFLQSMGTVIEAALAVAFALSAPIDDPARFEQAGRQHRAVLDALVRRDPQGASRAMSACILQGAKDAGIHRGRAPSVDVAVKLYGH
ncbi:MAG TPA: FadR/GntR family transcriptional regulator [Microvirga sp.]|jgi:DNA-binding FadR family transcriptional regulator|nr:FadR/GntR family transcriptional regulator [Microvirga sp.]